MPNVRIAASLVVTFAVLCISSSSRAEQVYLSLGDSLAFGYDPSDPSTLTPSLGDQGFVRPFADHLASGNGGVRPAVINLGIVGESVASFFDPSDLSPDGPPRVWGLNSNYADGSTSQNDLMLSTIADLQLNGHEISTVSLIFGANDIFGLINSADFQGATQEQQLALLGGTITAALNGYAIVLNELQALAPGASVYLPGYYNPFPAAIAPTQHALYDLILGAFNPGLESLAGQFGATYVDLYTPFVGRELELTNIGVGDVHPNRAGYEVIGSALVAASVPEPSSVLSLAIGVAGVVMLAGRRLSRGRAA